MVDDMKVLQINAVYGTGSTGVIVEDIHKMTTQILQLTPSILFLFQIVNLNF